MRFATDCQHIAEELIDQKPRMKPREAWLGLITDAINTLLMKMTLDRSFNTIESHDKRKKRYVLARCIELHAVQVYLTVPNW